MPPKSEPDGQPDGPSEKRTVVPRPRKACTICRGLKTRCLPDGEHHNPEARCARCSRLGLDCVYQRARRGRPPRVPAQLPPVLNNHPRPLNHAHPHSHIATSSANGGITWDLRGSVPVPPPMLQPTAGLSTSLPPSANPNSNSNRLLPSHPSFDMISSHWGPMPGQDGRPMTQASMAQASPPSALYQHSTGSMDNNTSPNLSNNANTSSHPTNRSLPNNNLNSPHLNSYLEPQLSGTDSQPQSVADFGHRESVFLSPIETGLLSEPEARMLFERFVEHLSPCGGLFDHKYHTFERIRTSPPLFTAILAATARYFYPGVREQLHRLYDSLVYRALMNGDHDLQLIQALLVFIYWRRCPDDRTTYLKLGMAGRLLSELRIEWTPSPAMPPQTEEEHLRTLDQQRTFYNVVSMDMWYSLILQLPPNGTHQLPPFQQVAYWAEQNQHMNAPGDYFKVFVSGMWDIQKDFAGGHFNVEEAVPFGTWSIDVKERRLIDHLTLWLNNPSLRGPQASQAHIIGKTTLLKLRVIGLLQNSAPKVTSASILSLVEEIGAIIARIAATREILYWFDVLCALLPMPGLLLHNARSHLLPNEYGRAMAYCGQMCDIFLGLSSINPTNTDNVMLGISRFYRKLGKAFDHFKAGSDDPQVETAINNLLQGVPHWSPLVNVVAEPGLVENLGATDWSWGPGAGQNPQWDGER